MGCGGGDEFENPWIYTGLNIQTYIHEYKWGWLVKNEKRLPKRTNAPKPKGSGYIKVAISIVTCEYNCFSLSMKLQGAIILLLLAIS